MSQVAGYLAFLLFVPLLSTIWIWMIVSKPAIVFHASQTFFNFLALCCFASAAAFQARFGVGPSGLSGFAIFISVAGMLFSLFMLLTPVIYEKYDKGARLARALKEVRVGFILSTTGLVVSLLIAFITTISAWTQPGCKNPDNDPNASKGKDFKKGLDGFCATKKAGAVFFWLAFVFWGCTFALTIIDWRNGKSNRPRDPPFTHPTEPSDHVSVEDEESLYHQPGHARRSTYDDDNDDTTSPFSDNHRYSGVPSVSVPSYTSHAAAQPRPSIDAYGAFSDPAPSGFGVSAPQLPQPSFGRPLSPPQESPRVSRTMQYADPYAAVRATVASGGQQAAAPPYPGFR
ncbi:hypothetical protein BXZ70DRAFT_358163 [Cristinia sonorae]|uniref:MARVEL domain-containing protein n=1 Tax=Cristinia sonorae TaxID=1940300 RepID=A0A8K0UIV3_9AGAR|nr:hypothetical protein BXZ70DRAFT_358163 [Cristinia sonorae]